MRTGAVRCNTCLTPCRFQLWPPVTTFGDSGLSAVLQTNTGVISVQRHWGPACRLDLLFAHACDSFIPVGECISCQKGTTTTSYPVARFPVADTLFCPGLAEIVDWSRFETVLSAEGRRAWWFEDLCDGCVIPGVHPRAGTFHKFVMVE